MIFHFRQASAQEKIRVTIGIQIENFTNPVKEAQKTRQVVELYRKYNFKGEFSISSWVSDEFLKCDPELIQMIKDSRMPLTGLQDQHLPFVIERTRDVS